MTAKSHNDDLHVFARCARQDDARWWSFGAAVCGNHGLSISLEGEFSSLPFYHD
jgi:hypothetical protein